MLPRTETSYSGCDDSDGLARQDTSYGAEAELDAHPQLLQDLQRVRDRYGPDMVEVEHLKLLDQVVVTLMLHVDYLDSTVYAAWGLAPKSQKKPVKVKVTFSRSGYTDAQKYLVACSQDGREWCGLAGQLARILKYFLDDQWKLRKQPSREVADMVGRGFGFEESTAALAAHGGNVERAVSAIVNFGKKGATVSGDGKWTKKKLPAPTYGLLVQLLDYAHARVKSCPDFCVICDQPHVFGTNMLKASVCYREVCAFAFQQLGVGSDAARELATDSGVVDLLVLMARAAAESGRWELIFNPYPTLFDPTDPSKKILHPSSKNIEAARKIFKGIPSVKDFVTGNAVDARQHQHARPLVQWIVTSNTSHLVKLRNEQRIACISTPHQFLLVSAPPEKQEAFQRQKKKYGTIWAFHGSATENWHSMYALSHLRFLFFTTQHLVPSFSYFYVFSLFGWNTECVHTTTHAPTQHAQRACQRQRRKADGERCCVRKRHLSVAQRCRQPRLLAHRIDGGERGTAPGQGQGRRGVHR